MNRSGCKAHGLGDNDNKNKLIKLPNMKAKNISTGLSHSLIIDINNNVWSFGQNTLSQLDFFDKNKLEILKAKSISVGTFHNLIIKY